jgi:hypothetical protein
MKYLIRTGLLLLPFLFSAGALQAQKTSFPKAGADSLTPSRSHFFDWINSQYEGTTARQTATNLDFFKWMHDEYGMNLDIYSLDVGNIDDGPYTAGVGRLIPYHYGSMQSREFKDQFPEGFGPLADQAATFGCRLGIWMGPDGFGNTPEDARTREDMMISLCRDYHFYLFKLDGVGGPFRKEKAPLMIETLKKCREYTPDLIVSSHRVDFGDAEPYITHHLWEGEETYVDVFINNQTTAPHHRAGSLARKLTPGMNRMYEDHGVCFSSCLDYWEDELILQAFNRSLILAPQIYGNPWFLRDDEYPRLARIFNLQKKYADILVHGFQLPENQYGPYAVSRGDGKTRLITLRNLDWNPKTYYITLDASIGLEQARTLEVRQYHPTEQLVGNFRWGRSVPVTVGPFRTCLLKVSSAGPDEITVSGCDYEIVRDVPGKPVLIDLLGDPGQQAKIRLVTGDEGHRIATLDGKAANLSSLEKGIRIDFPGEKLIEPWHRKLAAPQKLDAVPQDAEALFESTCFAADNNALEVRSIQRSGPSRIPQVEACRNLFLTKPMFINRGIWDRNLFDGSLQTFFMARLEGKMFRLDMGEVQPVDEIIIRIRDRQEYDLNPEWNSFAEGAVAEVSPDLVHWDTVELDCGGKGTIARIRLAPATETRYMRITGAPRRLAEIEAYRDGKPLDRTGWRASNLFGNYSQNPASCAWESDIVAKQIPEGSYLAVALNGKHGDEGAYAALRIDGKYRGAPDRAVSFPSNTWEYFNVESDSNYTYYFPLDPSDAGKKIEVVILGLKNGTAEFDPEVWITAYPAPQKRIRLKLD